MFKFPSFLLLLLGVLTGLALTFGLVQTILTDISVIPGWHTTVVEQVFWLPVLLSALCLVQLAVLVLYRIFGIREYVHSGLMAKMNLLILGAGTLLILTQVSDGVIAWYDGYLVEQSAFYFRTFRAGYFMAMGIFVLASQLFWWKRVRHSEQWTLFICLLLPLVRSGASWLG